MSSNHNKLLEDIKIKRTKYNEVALIAVENSINGKNEGFDPIGGLEFIERGDGDFLDKINFNYQRLLRTSSDTPQPTDPRIGQMWYDAVEKILKIWNGSEWQNVMTETKTVTITNLVEVKAAEETDLQDKINAIEKQIEEMLLQNNNVGVDYTLTDEYAALLAEKTKTLTALEASVSQTLDQYEQAQVATIKPGTISYASGVLNYWALDVVNYNNNTKFGTVSAVSGNNITLVPASVGILDNIIIDKTILIFEELIDGIWTTITQNYQVSSISGTTLTVYPLNSQGVRDDSIAIGIKVNQTCWQAGGWKLLISDFLDKGVETSIVTNRQEYLDRITDQTQLIADMLAGGYTEDDRDVVIAKAWLVVYQKDLILYDTIASITNYDEANKPQAVIDAELAVVEAKKATIVPPPSTKEIIINTIENISLTVLGSLDIGIDGYYSNLPGTTTTGVPSYISNFSYYGTYRGTPSIIGTNSNLGENYTVIRGYYDQSDGGRSDISFVIDVCKAAGLDESQRKNYKYNGFSALFKMNERNFWDYTGGNKTWQYLVNMTPLTTDPDSPNYGKYTIFCQVYAYKYYHSAQIGGRWLAIMNKYRNF